MRCSQDRKRKSMKDTARASSTEVSSANRKVKVLYIASWSRSGSTILGNILGQVGGFFSVGELRHIWNRGLIENRRCSCGLTFEECPVWSEVIARAFGGKSQVDAEKLFALRNILHTRDLLPIPTRRSPQERVSLMGEYREALDSLYNAVHSVSGDRVLIDSSKAPAYGYVLGTIPSLDLYVLHLVRDPRAVAYSWAARIKKLEMDFEGQHHRIMKPHSFLESSLYWNGYNLAAERTWSHNKKRYMFMRYEDFVENPRSATENCLKFLGEVRSQLPFVSEREVSLGETHTFSGNPNRFQRGTTMIKLDDEWKFETSSFQQGLVATVTGPLLIRYKYPLWGVARR
jgi:hypothetical protein